MSLEEWPLIEAEPSDVRTITLNGKTFTVSEFGPDPITLIPFGCGIQAQCKSLFIKELDDMKNMIQDVTNATR